MSGLLRIEIVHALADGYRCIDVTLPTGSRVRDALQTADVAGQWPDVAISESAMAIYGRVVTLETTLHDFDRIELLRPLLIDPKEARRRRAMGGIGD